MEKIDWIKDLVRAEQQLEESDMIDFTVGFDPDLELRDQTVIFLRQLKECFVESASAFNQMKSISLGNIRIYGIANSDADFMLFRNGFKLIFGMKKPGLVMIRVAQQSGFFPGAPADEANPSALNEDQVEAQWGAFGELIWTYRNMPVKKEYLVRYYLTRFIRESAK